MGEGGGGRGRAEKNGGGRDRLGRRGDEVADAVPAQAAGGDGGVEDQVGQVHLRARTMLLSSHFCDTNKLFVCPYIHSCCAQGQCSYHHQEQIFCHRILRYERLGVVLVHRPGPWRDEKEKGKGGESAREVGVGVGDGDGEGEGGGERDWKGSGRGSGSGSGSGRESGSGRGRGRARGRRRRRRGRRGGGAGEKREMKGRRGRGGREGGRERRRARDGAGVGAGGSRKRRLHAESSIPRRVRLLARGRSVHLGNCLRTATADRQPPA